MISIINQTFEPSIANNIVRYLQHPTATMIKDHFWWGDDEDEWTHVYGFDRPGRYYITFGGSPSGGVVRFRHRGWYEWRQQWFGPKILTPIPDGKVIIWRPENDKHSEAIRIVDGAYDLREYPHEEYYLDDVEDSYIENNPEAEMIHPDDMEEDEEDEYEGSDNSGEYIVDRAGNTIGRRYPEDESDDEARANFQSMAMNS